MANSAPPARCTHRFLNSAHKLSLVLPHRQSHIRHSPERSNAPSTVCQARGQSYHVEVEVNEDEDPEGVYKRFRNSCNLSGMVYEARRRQYFENGQDVKKRKQQEKGLRRMRDVRERFLQTYDDAHSDTPPFSELFAGDEDIYDVLGDASYDESLGSPVASQDQQDARNRSRGNGARSANNVVMRSVPSEGPRESKEQTEQRTNNGKPKARVQTARARRAAKQQAGRAK